jgi:hypothetical protein
VTADGPARNGGRSFWLATALAALTVVAFAGVAGNGFVAFDDPGYVLDNEHVRSGLTWDGIRWAFTTGAMSNWTPLTWLSHMAAAQCFGVDGTLLGLPVAGWHHLVDLALHTGSTLLLFRLLCTTTARPWSSAAVAALFAVHPLHVEAVAWVSARKDTLSTFLGFAALLAHAHAARRPGPGRRALTLALLAVGLMAKPMLVTWPVVCLLLDVWPLGRWRGASPGDARGCAAALRRNRLLLLEKVPMAAVVVASCAVTFVCERPAMYHADVVPVWFRAGNALVSVLAYLRQTLWPAGLAVLYPYPRQLAAGEVAAAALILAAITAWTLRSARARPWYFVGWLWFLVTLLPVLGLLPFGLHARADRFTYVPSVGLFVMLVAAVDGLAARSVPLRRGQPALVAAVLATLSVLTIRQTGRWSDTVTLFRHTCDVTRDNGWAHRILGTALVEGGRPDAAIDEFRQALQVWPQDPTAHNNLGIALERVGRLDEARAEFRAAALYGPGDPTAAQNLRRLAARGARPGQGGPR